MEVEKMKNRKLTDKERIAMYHIFTGLISEEIGYEKTIELLRKAKQELLSYEETNS